MFSVRFDIYWMLFIFQCPDNYITLEKSNRKCVCCTFQKGNIFRLLSICWIAYPLKGCDGILFYDHGVHGIQINRVALVHDAFPLHRELIGCLGMIALDASYGIPDWRSSLYPLDGGALLRYLKLYLPCVLTGVKFRFNDHRIRLIHGVPRFQVPDRHVMISR